MVKVSQCSRILRYMKETGGITSWEAIKEFGCTRLSGRIYDLRRAGWRISVEKVTGKNRYGDRVNYNRYFLEEGQNGIGSARN